MLDIIKFFTQIYIDYTILIIAGTFGYIALYNILFRSAEKLGFARHKNLLKVFSFIENHLSETMPIDNYTKTFKNNDYMFDHFLMRPTL